MNVKEVKFNLDLAKMILDGRVKAKIFSVDDHEMKLKEVTDEHAIITYINRVHLCGDGPEEDRSRDIEVDYRGYFCGERDRILSVKKVLVFSEDSEVVARQDIGDGLELVTRRVHNKWEPEVYKDLMSHKGEPTFFSKLCNYVAQMVCDRQHGEGSFAELTDKSKYKLYEEACKYVEAIRDLGHLMN